MKKNSNKRRSFIWDIPIDKFTDTVKNGSSWSIITTFFYGKPTNPRTVKERVIEEGIDISHLKNKKLTRSRKNLTDILKNDPNNKLINQRLKKKLLVSKTVIDMCYTCGIENVWHGNSLTLHLVHVDGNSTNNSINNIVIQCPNCFSQTKKGVSIDINFCEKCFINLPLDIDCFNCKNIEETELRLPSKEILKSELISMDFSGVQKKYGVTKSEIINWVNL